MAGPPLDLIATLLPPQEISHTPPPDAWKKLTFVGRAQDYAAYGGNKFIVYVTLRSSKSFPDHRARERSEKIHDLNRYD